MRSPAAGPAVVVRRRLRPRAGASALVARVEADLRPCCPRAFAVARQHPLGRLQFVELTGEPLALGIDARERLTDSLLFLGDLASNVNILDFRGLNRG